MAGQAPHPGALSTGRGKLQVAKKRQPRYVDIYVDIKSICMHVFVCEYVCIVIYIYMKMYMYVYDVYVHVYVKVCRYGVFAGRGIGISIGVGMRVCI